MFYFEEYHFSNLLALQYIHFRIFLIILKTLFLFLTTSSYTKSHVIYCSLIATQFLSQQQSHQFFNEIYNYFLLTYYIHMTIRQEEFAVTRVRRGVRVISNKDDRNKKQVILSYSTFHRIANKEYRQISIIRYWCVSCFLMIENEKNNIQLCA